MTLSEPAVDVATPKMVDHRPLDPVLLLDPWSCATPTKNEANELSFECTLDASGKLDISAAKGLSLDSTSDEGDDYEGSEGSELDDDGNDTGERHIDVVWPWWSKVTNILHHYIQKSVLTLSMAAARNPIRCIVTILILSFALIGTGIMTNFHIEVDESKIYTPFNAISRHHNQWYLQESGLAEAARSTVLMIHNHGNNVLGMDTMSRVFEALDTVRNTTGYNEICADGAHWDDYNEEFTCQVVSSTRFWYHDKALYNSQVKNETELVQQLSAPEYPGGVPMISEYVMGNLQRGQNGTISHVPAFFVYILLTDKGEATMEFETAVLDRLANLQTEWDGDLSNSLRLDYYAERSGADEFRRAIDADLFLLPCVFFVMGAFTCLVFFRRDLVQSRCLLGVGSVVSILLSLFAGFGLLFIFGVPFTSMTQLLPFVVFGVGLDDTFIITGAYLRTNKSLDGQERIRLAMLEAGPSITATTITTASAFLLGLFSSVPSIYWLCLYAFPTIIVLFLYQITFFVAILALDERRIQSKRMDVIICCKRQARDDESNDDEISETQQAAALKSPAPLADRIMARYACCLLHPTVRTLVVVSFFTFFGYCIHRTTMLKQDIDIKSLFPSDSYMIPAMTTVENFQERSYAFHIFFRNEDQGDPMIQQQMISFVEEIQALSALGAPPPLCWVRDLQALRETEFFDVVRDLPFEEQIQFAMNIPAFKEAYGNDIAIDSSTGNITASRCIILARNSHLIAEVQNTIDYLNGQRAVTEAQGINQNKAGGAESFFTFQSIYLVWEFYNVAISELIMTTVLSVGVVSFLSLVFIPHWTAVFFIVPMVSVVYIDLLGVMEMAGLDINAVTYVCLVISIGLIVDFLLHIMLRYVESSGVSRDDKVKETLETMGSSILLGGTSTLLGILALAFSTSMIGRTVFMSLCSMIILAIVHGLVVLPVLLSLVGPILPVESNGAFCDDYNQQKMVILTDFAASKQSTALAIIDVTET
ncbi:Pick C1-like protein 1 [Seminavis robusta]|uniref:Pick C1-like protein 1 n=1 Tax=Seminavis robusta TaxID=568900 RepID=A0A9N8DCM7_9STRA|nr:Pick C1-like protein 1 [Seminavis robusta]|eukprot:Sro62_g035290.1 Pick C1-like protein 1 (991) ;mRNA; f:33284-36521